MDGITKEDASIDRVNDGQNERGWMKTCLHEYEKLYQYIQNTWED